MNKSRDRESNEASRTKNTEDNRRAKKRLRRDKRIFVNDLDKEGKKEAKKENKTYRLKRKTDNRWRQNFLELLTRAAEKNRIQEYTRAL